MPKAKAENLFGAFEAAGKASPGPHTRAPILQQMATERVVAAVAAVAAVDIEEFVPQEGQ